MIAKCILVLAVCAQIYASPCRCGSSITIPSSDSCQSSQIAVISSSSSSSSSCSSSSEPSTVNRNLVGKGKYPVALKNCGPTPDQQIPVTTSRVTAPAQEKPTIRLPASIPAPKVISHCCTCYKTLLRPRVHQQIITVPVIQRYIETTHKPVIEKIEYEAHPVNCGSETATSPQFVEVGSSSSCGSSPSIEIPTSSVQTVDIPRVSCVETPRIEIPQVQTVEIPRVQTVEIPRVQTVEIPRVQTVVPQIQTVEFPKSFLRSSDSDSSSCSCSSSSSSSGYPFVQY